MLAKKCSSARFGFNGKFYFFDHCGSHGTTPCIQHEEAVVVVEDYDDDDDDARRDDTATKIFLSDQSWDLYIHIL